MPITIPPSIQYQGTLFSSPGAWNKKPPEGDRFISCEIDWGVPLHSLAAVQFTLSNSPVEFSQIAALAVDNSRCAADVSYLFPDTGKQLTVAAGTQGIYPVITNALTFFATAPAALTGDVTVFEILNSVPPPVSITPPSLVTTAGSASAISLAAVANTVLVAAPRSGTLQSATIGLSIATGAAPPVQTATIQLIDGASNILWSYPLSYPASTTTSLPIELAGVRQRFVNGLNFRVQATTMTGGTATVNVYYT